MTNTLIYLIGHPGVGKYTIAKEIAALTGARIVDNQSINNPIFSVVDTPFPKGVWQRITQVRAAVLETVATLSPPDWNFVLTNMLMNNAQSLSAYHSVLEVAELRGATFIPVRLLCDSQEHVKRIAQPDRAKRMKDTHPETARASSPERLYEPTHPNTLTLDVTHLSAIEAASIIIQYAGTKRKGTPE